MNKTAIVQLGRYGDIINILPVAKRISELDGGNPAFIVSAKYADILDGVSYVDPVPVQCDFADLQRGINTAKMHAEKVVVSQVYGWNFNYKQEMDSFSVESWYRAGFLHEYDLLPPPLFDRRDAEREQDLRNFFHVHEVGKPLLLINFGGHSSPYPHTAVLYKRVMAELESFYHIVDLTPAKCHRMYDMLGLMDSAHALITIDTGTLHLAGAAPTMGVAALIVDTPTLWHGARPPRNTFMSMRYRESQHRMDHLINTLRSGVYLNRDN